MPLLMNVERHHDRIITQVLCRVTLSGVLCSLPVSKAIKINIPPGLLEEEGDFMSER